MAGAWLFQGQCRGFASAAGDVRPRPAMQLNATQMRSASTSGPRQLPFEDARLSQLELALEASSALADDDDDDDDEAADGTGLLMG